MDFGDADSTKADEEQATPKWRGRVGQLTRFGLTNTQPSRQAPAKLGLAAAGLGEGPRGCRGQWRGAGGTARSGKRAKSRGSGKEERTKKQGGERGGGTKLKN